MSRFAPAMRDAETLFALSVPPPPSLTLREVVEEAVAWQDEAEAVIELCVPAGGKTQVLARRGALVATVYGSLRGSLASLPPSPLVREVEGLVNHHQLLLQQALLLAFRCDSPLRERAAAHCRGGLGDPGRRLRVLRWTLGRPGQT